MNTQRIVIIGGGFGGLHVARSLREAPVEITLLDRRNFNLFQPLLYQVATGTLAPGDISVPLRSLLKHQKNARVLLAEAMDFNLDAKEVILRDGEKIPYDTLIVAAGSEPNYFGHDEWRKWASGLKTVEDATSMRSRILLAFEKAERETDAEKIKSGLTFVVTGAGPTGVELSGALAEMARKTMRDGFRHIQPASSRILLVDAVAQVLPGYPPKLAARAEAALVKLGVTVFLNTKVIDVQPGSVHIEGNGRSEWIQTQTVLWTAGVRASPLGQMLAKHPGIVLDKAGRVVVASDMTIPGHPDIFVVGDLASFMDKNQKLLPGVAQVAMQEGRYVADLLLQRLKGKALPPFQYHNPGSLATIGRNEAVADLGPVHLSGFIAWIIWAFVHIFQLLEFESRFLVMMQWAWYYLMWHQTDLLITAPRDHDK